MTSPETRPAFEATSAAGAMRTRRTSEPILIGCVLASLGTSTAYALPQDIVNRSARSLEQTTAGAVALGEKPAGADIGELRRLSGLTWDQLARIFKVSRRSLHFWASGKSMSPSNEEHLQRVLAVVRRIDTGSSSANRTALLAVREDGSILFDYLIGGDYERALAILGPGRARRVSPSKFSEEARAVRNPRSPEELVGALQDRIHPTSGRILAAKPITIFRRK